MVRYLEQCQAQLLLDPAVIEEHGGTFHRANTRNTSIIDLSFAAGFQHLQWQDWHYGESTGSDHEAIFFHAPLSSSAQSSQSPLPPIFNLKKADWALFQLFLLQLEKVFLPQLFDAIQLNDIDTIAVLLQGIITQAADAAIPHCRPSAYSKAWWTDDLSQLRKQFHSLRRRAKKSLFAVDIEEARVARNKYFHSISHAKAQHWEQFLSEARDKHVFTAFSYSDPGRRHCPLIPSLRYSTTSGHEVVATTFAEQCQALVLNLFPSQQNEENPDSSTSSSLNSSPVQDTPLPEWMPELSPSARWDPFLSPRMFHHHHYQQLVQLVLRQYPERQFKVRSSLPLSTKA